MSTLGVMGMEMLRRTHTQTSPRWLVLVTSTSRVGYRQHNTHIRGGRTVTPKTIVRAQVDASNHVK